MYLEWLVIACILALIVRLLRNLWWRPLQIYKDLRAQGLMGPPFIPIVGNLVELNRLLAEAPSTWIMKNPSNEIVPYILPYYTAWSKIYGETFVYCVGSQVRVTITDPELIKEVLNNKFGHCPKLEPTTAARDLLGDGLLTATGEKWAEQRRILNHGFDVDKLKVMVERIADLATKMLDDWSRRIIEANQPKDLEIEVLKEYQILTADIIAHTAFGTSYEAGKTVFKLQQRQFAILLEAMRPPRLQLKSLASFYCSFLPLAINPHRQKIRKAIEDNLQQLVQKRIKLESQNDLQQNDLLGVMICAYNGKLRGNQKNLRMSIQDIVDECKTFFLAGQETTAAFLTWTTMLLALHPDWQERLRAEVINVCGSRHPSYSMLNQLKLVGMVLNEVLRLYPGSPHMMRGIDRDMKLGKIVIPKGTVVSLLPLVTMHNKQIWGEDADEFNPERFAEGIANASKHRSAFMPFSLGPRNCIGQVFALMEAKVVLCKLLQRFSFQLSPAYVHAPGRFSVPKPEHGMQILVKPYN
ncbi:hypothetical protein O6H91_10G072000 [Diphasiastrum complanatum]|uniref:Uncharacterized protein n=1 Tax=Diphasiastrum complanatum TaxID=34168 RepID=A0ACC2CID0_DIPCM|nr:hypothetical protein O6H91_10G072000 [Diphasiastrum complanatum]